ncbi:MAG: acetylxylan esterase [Bacteroidia bacterium]|nr:acetylxylan esterase [Bacteroidia bacterium]
MKIRVLILFLLVLYSGIISAQLPADVYRKPLKEVLTDIEKRYHVKLQYSESLVKDVMVMYPTWRYRMDTEATLTNILLPLDMIFEKTGENVYLISKYAYHVRPVEEGKKHLEKLLASYPDLKTWEARKAELRKCFLEQLGLNPLPEKTQLDPVYTPIRKFDGYSVQNVGIQTIPGFYLCGSLYRPAKGKGHFPAVLSPHGHFNSNDLNENGRYRPDQQYRCAMLAKMGAVVFSYEMFGYGESLLQIDKADHKTGFASTMQTLNSMRVIDFLTSLPYVDPKRIGCTGESGGGTQTFLITALDDRITVSVPVVMVSSYFFGGCACESGLPIHSCTDLGTNNAEIAAMASPRPMLVISDGDDWTANVPVIEFPYLKKVYELYGKSDNVENVHLANEGHDYGVSKRMAMYDFMARHLGLNINAVKDKNGKIDESKVTIENHEAQLVFGKDGKLPSTAKKGVEAIRKELKSLQEQ